MTKNRLTAVFVLFRILRRFSFKGQGEGKREEGKQIYISLSGDSLVPHPYSLKMNLYLVEDEVFY